MRLPKLLFVMGLLAAACVGAPTGAGASEATDEAARYEGACKTYENRARFLSREGLVTFVVAMAEGCAAAQRSLRNGDEAEREAALTYLDGLMRLRDLVIAMNMGRMYGANTSPFAKPIQGEGRLVTFYGVSETGEFLIAKRMGLIQAFRDWQAEAAEIGIAFVR